MAELQGSRSHFETETRARVIEEARTWIGTPYRHQASCKAVGSDCLGLIRGIWRHLFGEEPEILPAYSSDWAEAGGQEALLEAAGRHMTACPFGAAEPGDMLVFRWRPHLPAKHVGILMPGNRLCHAYQAAGAVVDVPLAEAWTQRLAGAFVFPERAEVS